MSKRKVIRGTLLERFLAHTKRLPNGCLECELKKSDGGYPTMRVGEKGNWKMRLASHVAWFLHYGDWPPEGSVTDHICHDPMVCALGRDCPHRRCTEWSHLKLTDRRGNNSSERSNAGRAAAARAATITHCKYEHPLTGDNVYWYKGCRRCRTCQRTRDMEFKARRRAAKLLSIHRN